MKNQVIKKIMAYLLVGAMVITTPMTASANEIEDAYSSTEELDGKSTGSGSGSGSGSNSGVIDPIEDPQPDKVEEFKMDILGIALDKNSLELNVGDTEYLQARVLFNDYNPEDEEMDWVTQQEKRDIESNVRWQIDDVDVAEGELRKDATNATLNDNTRLYVTGKAHGTARVTAWVDNGDGVWNPGEYKAEAVVTVNGAESLQFDAGEVPFVLKRQYDLKKYTYFCVDGKPVQMVKKSSIPVTFSLDSAVKGVTLKEDGTLKITDKKLVNTEFKINFVAANGAKGDATIKVSPEVKATGVTIDKGSALSIDISEKSSETIVAKLSPENSTDGITWTSSNKKVATVTPSDDDEVSATINALSLGTTKITAKATNGKKAVLTLTVNANNAKIEVISGSDTTWSGKNTYMTAVLTDKNGNVLPISAASLKGGIKWSVATANKKDAKVSGKKDTAIVKPANLLSNIENGVQATITATNKSTNKSGSKTLTIKQSDIKSIEMFYNGKSVSAGSKEKAYVGKTYSYGATATAGDVVKDMTPEDLAASVGWAVSGSATTINDSGITAVKAGKTKVTASYVTLSTNAKGKTKAKLNKKTFTIDVIQNATAITLNKTAVVVNPKNKEQKVKLSVKATTPKKASYNITWKVKGAYCKDGTLEMKTTAQDEKAYSNVSGKGNKNITVTIPADAQPGTTYKVGAYTDGGVVAYAYIYVTDKTSKVTASIEGGSVKLGESKQITTNVNELLKQEGATGFYKTEPVTYTVDKTSAKYIRVDSNGNVTGIQKTPNKKVAKVTVKTISGKKATVKITVN